MRRGHGAVVHRIGRIVDRCDVERQCIGRLIGIHSTAGRATIILHLKSEAGVIVPIGIGSRGEDQLASSNVSHWHRLPSRDSHATEAQHANGWQAADLDRQQAMGLGIPGITEAKVRHGDAIGRVLRARDGFVDPDGLVVDGGYLDEDRRGVCPSMAIGDLVGDDGVTIEPGLGREFEGAIGIDDHRTTITGGFCDRQLVAIGVGVVAQNLDAVQGLVFWRAHVR